jgi:hypothetical protein
MTEEIIKKELNQEIENKEIKEEILEENEEISIMLKVEEDLKNKYIKELESIKEVSKLLLNARRVNK